MTFCETRSKRSVEVYKAKHLHPLYHPPPPDVTDITTETSLTVTDITMETSQTVTDIIIETSQTVTDNIN